MYFYAFFPLFMLFLVDINAVILYDPLTNIRWKGTAFFHTHTLQFL